MSKQKSQINIRGYYTNRGLTNFNYEGENKESVLRLDVLQDGTHRLVDTGEVKDLQVDIQSHYESSLLKNQLLRFNAGELGLLKGSEGMLYEDLSELSHIREENLQKYKDLQNLFEQSNELKFAYGDLKGLLKNELRKEYIDYYDKINSELVPHGFGVDKGGTTLSENQTQTKDDKKGNSHKD